MSISFKNFKKEFYSKFTDYKIFEGREFNYFKIALEGLKVNYFQFRPKYTKLDDRKKFVNKYHNNYIMLPIFSV